MLTTRLILGSLLIGVLLLALWIDLHFGYPYASMLLLVLTGTSGALEWNRMMGRETATYGGLLGLAAFLYPLSVCLAVEMEWAIGQTDFFFLFLFLLLLLARAVFSGHVKNGLDRVARTLLGFLLLFLFYRLCLVLLSPDPRKGIVATYCLVLTSKSCDMGAYLIGRALGKKKLIPRVSPGKTVAGAFGGILFSTSVGAATLSLWADERLGFALAFGLLIGGVTILSDLAESLVKRCVNVKDSAALLPQFGGVLDLIDSLFLAAPAGYLLLILA